MSNFVDECALCVRGGDGGSGCVSFRREAHVDRGGPDGGDGGSGGDVWLVTSSGVASLKAFRDHPHRRAGDGSHGSGSGKHGRSGLDVEVLVPVGTVVRNREGELLVDLLAPGQRWLAARGGAGGRGNARFLTNRRRAPRFAEQGEAPPERWLQLEMKLLADVALVGMPNAGKSTLISRISAAKARVADYPFTTLIPNLGVVATDDGESFVVADVPGLIEGASEGKGLGQRFLRHVERCTALVVLLDLAPDAALPPQRQLDVLLEELGAYQPDLLLRRRLLVGSKSDVGVGFEGADLNISSVTGSGLRTLIGRLAEMLAEARAEERTASPAGSDALVVHRLLPSSASDEVRVVPEGDAWRVLGRPALRAVALNDLTDPGAMEYALARLRGLGVDRLLARARARSGDEVRVGEISFEYMEDSLLDTSVGQGVN